MKSAKSRRQTETARQNSSSLSLLDIYCLHKHGVSIVSTTEASSSPFTVTVRHVRSAGLDKQPFRRYANVRLYLFIGRLTLAQDVNPIAN